MAGRPGHLGRDRAGRAGCLDRGAAPGHPDARVRRRRRARHRPRAGHGPLGQLVQPGAVRPGDPCPLGAAHHLLRGRPGAGVLPPDVPLRVPVVHRRRVPGDVGRPALQAGPRPGVRPVRRRVLRGPGLDRVHAGGRRPPHPRPAPQRLDGPDRLPAGRHLHDRLREAPPRPRGDRGAPRGHGVDGRHGHGQGDGRRLREVRLREVRLREVRLREVRLREVRLREGRSREGGLREVRPGEVRRAGGGAGCGRRGTRVGDQAELTHAVRQRGRPDSSGRPRSVWDRLSTPCGRGTACGGPRPPRPRRRSGRRAAPGRPAGRWRP
ncbi:hypothetical protein SGPA1_31315 [Streptomyces misionensis JCM 4497]